jgi:hypothetical protein
MLEREIAKARAGGGLGFVKSDGMQVMDFLRMLAA